MDSLKNRLDKLPLVLAGPILRQVTPNAVTVWFALLEPATVSLRVFETGAPGSPLMATGSAPNTDPAATTPIGANLHIVAATVRSNTALVPGKIYCYDATIVTTGNNPTTKSLAEAITAPTDSPPAKPLAYEPHDFPSFALPPEDLNHLRIVHGSCRKPHGGTLPKDTPPTPDQLATLDGFIGDSANNAMGRPHQLFLTGDQIYADDCDDELLASLTDAGDVLLGWSNKGETFTSSDPTSNDTTTYSASDLAPSTRWDVITNAGFTGDDRRSHLISLGEFFAMYLFAWSDVLWSDPLTYDEFEAITEVTLTEHPDFTVFDDVKSGYEDRQKAVQKFRETLPAVRRALANVPTYMILDDHEVTDDFNMTRHFVEKVYDDDLGVRLVQNALTAYAICQVWGNVPEQFDPNTPTAAGTQLLSQLSEVAKASDNAGEYEQRSEAIMKLVGVHNRADMNDGTDGSMRAFHEGTDADTVTVNGVAVNTVSLRYNFTVEGPSHQALFTDTRTWRGFAGHNEMPTLLYKQLPDQIVSAKPLDSRLQLVICSTNAPPIAGIRFVVHAPGLAWISDAWHAFKRDLREIFGHDSKPASPSFIDYGDLYDSWDFPSRNFDEMIAALTNRLPQADGTIVAPVLLLSGDVHFSFSSRMAYWATARLGDTTPPHPTKITIAQLVSSSLKNEKQETVNVQLGGYAAPDPKVKWLKAAPYIAAGLGAGTGLAVGAAEHDKLKDTAIGAAAGLLLELIVIKLIFGGQVPPPIPEAYVGWNIPIGGPDKLIVKDGAATTFPFKVTAAAPTFDQNLNPSALKGALTTPDYRYRLDYLTSVRGGQTALGTLPFTLPTDQSAAAWVQAYSQAANARTDLIGKGTKLPDCIGHNAIAEITFVWPAGDAATTGRLVHHRVHWQDPFSGPTWAEYDVSLDIDDKNYPDLTKDAAP